MKTRIIVFKIIFLVFVAAFSLDLRADALADYNKLLSEVSQSNLENLDSGTKDKIDKLSNLYIAALKEISESDLPERDKERKIVKAASDMGEFFQNLTEPYDDIPSLPRKSIYASKFKTVGDRIQEKLNSIMDGIVYLSLSLWRDVKTTPKVLPVVGVSTERSQVIAKFAKKLKDTTDNLNAIVSAKGCSSFCMGIKQTLISVENSEPVKHGVTNKMVFNAYVGFAIYFFINPSDLFFEPTTVGPAVYSILEVGYFAMLARARRLNSGLDFYKIIKKIKLDKDFDSKEQNVSCKTNFST